MLPETQSKGRVPVDNDLLNRLQRGTQIKSAAVFNRKGVMLSGPQVLLILSQLSSVWTSSGVIWIESIMVGCGESGINESRFEVFSLVKMEQKY